MFSSEMDIPKSGTFNVIARSKGWNKEYRTNYQQRNWRKERKGQGERRWFPTKRKAEAKETEMKGRVGTNANFDTEKKAA